MVGPSVFDARGQTFLWSRRSNFQSFFEILLATCHARALSNSSENLRSQAVDEQRC